MSLFFCLFAFFWIFQAMSCLIQGFAFPKMDTFLMEQSLKEAGCISYKVVRPDWYPIESGSTTFAVEHCNDNSCAHYIFANCPSWDTTASVWKVFLGIDKGRAKFLPFEFEPSVKLSLTIQNYLLRHENVDFEPPLPYINYLKECKQLNSTDQCVYGRVKNLNYGEPNFAHFYKLEVLSFLAYYFDFHLDAYGRVPFVFPLVWSEDSLSITTEMIGELHTLGA